MPNYDFQCEKCEMTFKKSLPFGNKELPTCPKCKGKTRKIITPPAVLFRGSGFYKTDSSKSSAPFSKQTETMKAEVAKPAEAPKAAEKPKTSNGDKT